MYHCMMRSLYGAWFGRHTSVSLGQITPWVPAGPVAALGLVSFCMVEEWVPASYALAGNAILVDGYGFSGVSIECPHMVL